MHGRIKRLNDELQSTRDIEVKLNRVGMMMEALSLRVEEVALQYAQIQQKTPSVTLARDTSPVRTGEEMGLGCWIEGW